MGYIADHSVRHRIAVLLSIIFFYSTTRLVASCLFKNAIALQSARCQYSQTIAAAAQLQREKSLWSTNRNFEQIFLFFSTQ